MMSPRFSAIRWWRPTFVAGIASLLFLAPGCLHPRRQTARGRSAPSETFTPSVEGKKLLHYRGPSYEYMRDHTAEMEQVAFDGLILGGFRPFYINEKKPDFDAWVARMKAIPFRRYTDNFYLCYSGVDAVEQTDFDWFHDFDWIVDNWRMMAKAAKDAGFKGICFDTEAYGGKPLFGYEKQKYAPTKSFREYQAQAQRRGAEIMRAVNKVYPDITIILLFGYSGSYCGVPQHPLASAKAYTLVSAFVDGLLSECGPSATVHDMHEQSFSFRVPGSYARARRLMKEIVADHSAVPEKYRASHKAGFSFWVDCWGDNSKGRPFDVRDFETNYYTPAEMAYSLHSALAYSDRYVWMWPGAVNWWKGTVSTLDETAKEVTVPLPGEYARVLDKAREPDLPEPPRDRKPNLWRIESASTWKNWSDEEAFADLWDEYQFVADLPPNWRFKTDPDEIGRAENWADPELDDSNWAAIRIREFWEPQGYSPYDGQAWYRVEMDSPRIPGPNRGVFLAFGAVADEATVYVNGTEVFASIEGDNIRHRRFLADVSSVWKPGAKNQVTVRVWNVSWCGGIWKNVKLVIRR